VSGYIVVFDNEDGLCIPFSWDEECDGAIECGGDAEPVALFETRQEARKAIAISKANAVLLRTQDKVFNSDFTDSLKCLRILKLKARKAVGNE
jgi:hypothetical protein